MTTQMEIQVEPVGLFMAGRWVCRPNVIEVRNPYDDQLVGVVSAGTAADVRAAIGAGKEALRDTFPLHERYSVLMRAAELVDAKRDASLDNAIAMANRVPYGLHAAIFTEGLRDAFHAIRNLEFGGIMVNDSTDYRLDVMPFGGPKLSGIGREGIRFALQEMTETRVVCLNL